MTMADYYDKHGLNAYFQKDVLENCQLLDFQKGQSILAMGQPVDGLYCLVEGRSKTVFMTETGRQLLLSFQDPFKLFGDLEIFDQQPEATNTVEAVSDCKVIFIPLETVLNGLAQEPKFLKQLAISLGKKLGRVIKNSALNTLSPVDVRLASYIMATLDLSGSKDFSLNLSATADQLGSSFRHIHRTMTHFKNEGMIEQRGKGYRVLKPEALAKLASNAYVFS